MRLFDRQSDAAKLRSRRDVDGLMKLLDSREIVTAPDGRRVDLAAETRREALAAIVELDHERALEALARGLSDHVASVRLAAVEGLRARPDQDATDLLAAGVGAWSLPVTDPTRAGALEALLERADERTPYRVVTAMLHRTGEDALIEADEACLMAVLVAEESSGLRGELAWQIVSKLADAVEEVRERTEQVLVWLSPDSVDAAIAALARGDATRTAVRVLARTKDNRAVEALLGMTFDHDPEVRREVALALGYVKDPRAVEALTQATYDPDYSVRDAAFRALDELGPAGVVVAMANAHALFAERLDRRAALGGSGNGSSLPALPPGGEPHPSDGRGIDESEPAEAVLAPERPEEHLLPLDGASPVGRRSSAAR